ncbi:hypothetical protein GHH_c29460 [Geobacillus sp. GHH01]|nr:hypothetical protein GHH_c29460 [Geobacillus sp. GHH01]EPR26875.1 hypothetical protein I656_03498 [Geobacillus sp. WSUCF1]
MRDQRGAARPTGRRLHRSRGMTMDKRASLIQALQTEMKRAALGTYPACIDSFARLWDYEFGSFDQLPPEIERLVAHRAAELGWMDDV